VDRVLIVDDEELIREEMADILEYEGFECSQASCANDALEKIQHDSNIEIVITDMKMPGSNGLEFIEFAKKKYHQRNLEYIIITGHGDYNCAVTAVKLGAVDFLQKPLDRNMLIHAVTRAQDKQSLIKLQNSYHTQLKNEVSTKFFSYL